MLLPPKVSFLISHLAWIIIYTYMHFQRVPRNIISKYDYFNNKNHHQRSSTALDRFLALETERTGGELAIAQCQNIYYKWIR